MATQPNGYDPIEVLRNTLTAQPVRSATPAPVLSADVTPNEVINALTGVEGQGAASATGNEKALRNQDANMFMQLTPEQRRTVAEGGLAYDDLANNADNSGSYAADLIGSFSRGAAASATGIGALAGGLVSDKLGALGAEAAKYADEAISNNMLSAEARNQERISQLRQQLSERDSAQQAEQDIANGDSAFTANLRRVGRDALNYGANSLNLGNVIANAAGSMALPVAGAAAIGGRAALTGAGLSTVQRAGIGALTAATEAGGAYSDASSQVAEMSPQELAASKPYQALIARGMSPEEAMLAVRGDAGLRSAAYVTPVAFGLGAAVAPVMARGLGVRGAGALRQNIADVLSEGVEETAQGAAGSLLTNLAIQQTANQNQDLADGVGSSIAEGIIGGTGAAGAMRTPALAGMAGTNTKTGVSNVVNWATTGRETKTAVETQKAAEEKLDAVIAPIVATPPEKQTPEQAEVIAVAEAVRNVSRFSVEDIGTDSAPVQNILNESQGNAITAIAALSRIIDSNSTQYSDLDKQEAAEIVYHMIGQLETAVNPVIAERVANVAGMSEVLADYQSSIANVQSLPTVVKALAKLREKDLQAQSQPVSEEFVPEDVTVANAVIRVAETDPENIDVGNAQKILAHIESGKMPVSADRKAALQTAIAMTNARLEYYSNIPEPDSASEDVSRQIQAFTDRKGLSAVDHVAEIRKAAKAQDLAKVDNLLLAFENFAWGQQNKADALARSLETGRTELYDAVDFETQQLVDRTEYPQQVHPNSPKSVEYFNRVKAEAQFLNTVVDGLRTAYYPMVGRDSYTPPTGAVEQATTQQSANTTPDVDQPVTTPTASTVATPTNPEPIDSVGSSVVAAPVQEAVEPAATAPVKQRKPRKSRAKPKSLVNRIRELGGLDINKTAEYAGMSRREANRRRIGLFRVGTKQGLEDLISDGSLDDYLSPESLNDPDAAYNEIVDLLTKDEPARPYHVRAAIEAANMNEQSIAEAAQYYANEPLTDEALNDLYDSFTPEEREIFVAEYENALQNLKGQNAQQEPTETASTEGSTPDSESSDARSSTSAERTEDRQKTTREVVEREVEDSPKGLSADPRLDSLFSGSTLKKGFSYPNEPTSNLTGLEDVLEFVFEEDGLGTALSQEERASMAALAGITKDRVSKLLDDYLNQKASKNSDRTRLQKLVAGEKINRFGNTLALNLVDVEGDTAKFNDALLETAMVAAVSYFTQKAGKKPSYQNKERISQATGIDEANLPPGTVEAYNSGFPAAAVQNELANKIIQYWGMRPKSSAPKGWSVGTANALAGMIMQSWFQTKLMDLNEFSLVDGKAASAAIEESTGQKQFVKDTVRKFVSFRLSKMEAFNEIVKKNPYVLDNAVAPETTVKDVYLDGEPMSPPVMQMNSPWIRNTASQMKALRANAEIPARIDTLSLGIYEQSSEAELAEFFLGISPDGFDNMNVIDRDSTLGRLVQLRGSLSAMQDLREQIEATGKPLGEVDIRYNYNMSSVGRMQQLAAYGNQASKYVREVVMPTWSTLDLSGKNQAHTDAWDIGLGQAFGVKVHNMSREALAAKLEEIKTQIQPAVDMMADYVARNGESKSFDVRDIGKHFAKKGNVGANIPPTPLALHAVLELARFQAAADKSAFRTSLYAEADGVTNGPVNAMMLAGSSSFTPRTLERLEKGGIFFTGSKKDYSQFAEAPGFVDTYGSNSTVLANEMRGVIGSLKGKEQTDAMYALSFMDALIPGASFTPVNEHGDYTIEFDRSFSKNPLTITVYGSGSNGILNKYVSSMIDSIYAAATQGLQDNPDEPYLFGDPAKARRLQELFYRLTGERLDVSDLRKLEISPKQREAITKKMKKLINKPLKRSVDETIGSDVIENMELVGTLTNFQSEVFSYLYRQEIQKAYDALPERSDDGSPVKGDGLSESQEKAIFAKLKHLYPTIVSDDLAQEFLPSNLGLGNAGDPNIGLPLRPTGAQNLPIFEPNLRPKYLQAASVRARAQLIIGSGDGMAMQTLVPELEEAGIPSLAVFDGVHYGLADMAKGSELANKAVRDSWDRNLLQAVSNNFSAFLDSVNKDVLETVYQEMKNADDLRKANWPDAPAFWTIEELDTQIKAAALGHTAQIAAVNSVAMSVDQMAAGRSPYQTKGIELPVDAPAGVVANVLTEAYNAELARLKALKPTPANKYVMQGMKLSSGTTRSTLGAVVNQMIQDGSMPKELIPIYKTAMRSPSVRDTVIFSGSAGQLANEPAAQFALNGKDGGYDPVTNSIVVTGNRKDVLLHEMLHAATYAKLVNALDRPDTTVTGVAVGQLRKLKDQFLAFVKEAQDSPLYNEKTRRALDSAAYAIEKANDEAASLNEMMAWSLSNPEIVSVTRNVPVWEKLASNIMKVIKRVVFGEKHVTVPDTLFDQIRFNTLVIANGNSADVASLSDQTVLPHYTPTQAEIRDKLRSQVVNMLPPAKQTQAHILSATVLQDVASIFNMPMAESQVFSTLVGSLALGEQLNSSTLGQMNRLYLHAISQMDASSFVTDPNDPNDVALSNDKYQMLVGIQNQHKGTMLPVFVALANVDDSLRNVLSTISTPKTIRKDDGTMDSALRDFANTQIDKLSDALTETNKTTNVLDAMDKLSAMLVETEKKASFGMEAVEKVEGRINKANDYTANKFDSIAAKELKRHKSLPKNRGRIARTVDNLRLISAAAISKTAGEAVSKSVIDLTNEGGFWDGFREFVNDVIGRTDSTADFHAMNKQIKADLQRDRQNYRNEVPRLLAGFFSREMTTTERKVMNAGLAKTDLASLPKSEALRALKGSKERKAMLKEQKAIIDSLAQDSAALIADADALAEYMVTGKVAPMMLRNAVAIEAQVGRAAPNRVTGKTALIRAIDRYTSLKALDSTPDVDTLTSLAQNEDKGVSKVMDYLAGQRAEEQRKALGAAKFNYWKGNVPASTDNLRSLRIAPANDKRMREMGYTRLKAYGHNTGDTTGLAYFYMPASGTAAFSQGLVQNADYTAGGVDVHTGRSTGLTAGYINMLDGKNIRTKAGAEALIPVFDATGKQIGYERSVDPAMLARLEPSTDIFENIGVWRGRQVEEEKARIFNEELIKLVRARADEDFKNAPLSSKMQYVDVMRSKDPIIADAVSLFSTEFKRMIGDEPLMIRKDLLPTVLGYRNPSIHDLWSGTSRWSKEQQTGMKRVLKTLMGDKAYRYMATAESVVHTAVHEAKVMIVVKSVIVPAANMFFNMTQLLNRGVGIRMMTKEFPKKLVEIDGYVTAQRRLIALEVEQRSTSPLSVEYRKLAAERQAIEEGFKRMSIWPLIEAGEFSSISDAGIADVDTLLTKGKLYEYLEKKVDQLPPGFKTVGKYAILSKDTAMYEGLQKTIQYSDFLAKAVFYEHLTKEKGRTHEEAIRSISEEFVDYDRLPGRARQGWESNGLLWFYNFSIRSAKVGLALIRENPVHTLLSMGAAGAAGVDIGSPVTDNIFAKILTGRLGYSIGPEQGFNAVSLNPWINLGS